MYVFQNLVEKQFARIFEMESGLARATSTWISTGWLTLLLAIGLCDSIKVYGMIDKDYCKRNQDSAVPYHYYEDGKLSECEMYKWHDKHHTTGHPYIREEVIFRRLVSLFNISFHHPMWKLHNVDVFDTPPRIRNNPLKS
ncbi:alpha-N-acetyl-neuraminyl-2,3-beta-galactosyl-1,3-N-acetyl-galactosaminide alpha-2,6-sialyltransferase-like [Anneissia japonica]|uniref:alpha-N-acetyl-neuraminyl-2,3-beta-galactosyl-1, 3-N-acetyl-galactosaminide alpha-2,6-sialyltransferase-like n=1 Tax=Anneissia japonica TaxID=1529436 RepID=UPI0014256E30|nr:alpha-N-acetyl-neuraminyl-2,3-beta-galactosyl-1,3-N-acetyl-galactosaminide alpha-2,6-sialyltransferase-like [Anneissia japonica]